MKLHHIATSVLLAGTLFTGSHAAAQTMTVTMRDGQTAQFATDDIEKVTFSANNGLENGPFTIKVTEVTGSTAHLAVTPHDNSTRYYFDVCSREAYETHGVATIVRNYYTNLMGTYPGLDMSMYLEGSTSLGPDEDTVTNLPDDTEMVCYAIAISNDCKPVGEPSVVAFRTLKGGDPADCTFTLACTSVHATSASVTVTPSDFTVRYWYGCYAASAWPGDVAVQMLVKQSIDQAVADSGRSLAYVIDRVSFRGPIQMDESGFEPSTRYYLYAFAIDSEGNASGPMFKETFTTLANDYSDADVSLSYRYFDGSALKAAYPDKFANADGKVIVQARITPNEVAEHFAWGLLRGDYSDEMTYPEEAAKQAVLQGGWIDNPAKNIYASYGEATFLYFGSDAYGIEGPLHRLVVDFKAENARPVSEYQDLDNLSAAAAPMKAPFLGAKASHITKQINKIYTAPEPYRKRF